MQLIFKPSDSDDVFDIITVDMDKVKSMNLSEYGLDIEFYDGSKSITIDALLCEYNVEIKRCKQ